MAKFKVNFFAVYLACALTLCVTIMLAWSLTTPPSIDPCLYGRPAPGLRRGVLLWLTLSALAPAHPLVALACSLTRSRSTFQCNTDSFAFFWALLVLLSVQAVIQIVVAFMDWRMGGQIGGESASLVPVSLCIVAILLVFISSSLVNTSSLDAGAEQQASPREAMYSSLIIMLLTSLSLVLIVFSKVRYVSLSRNEALKLFLGHSAPPSARTEGGSTATAFLQAPGSVRTDDSSAANLRAPAQRSSEDSGHGSRCAEPDPPRADVAAPAAAPTATPQAPTALVQV